MRKSITYPILSVSKSNTVKNCTQEKNTKIEEIQKNNFMQNDNPFIKKLNDGERDAMEQDISIAECHKALINMNNGRSPGIDG